MKMQRGCGSKTPHILTQVDLDGGEGSALPQGVWVGVKAPYLPVGYLMTLSVVQTMQCQMIHD
jgi:hypothetical protein